MAEWLGGGLQTFYSGSNRYIEKTCSSMNCENCGNSHDGSYGSGRFCSAKCSRSFSTKNKRKEINEKVADKLRGKLLSEEFSDKMSKHWKKYWETERTEHRQKIVNSLRSRSHLRKKE